MFHPPQHNPVRPRFITSTPLSGVLALALPMALVPACEKHPVIAGQAGYTQEAWDACLGAPPGPDRGWPGQGPDLVGTHVTGSTGRWAVVRTFRLEGMTTAEGVSIQQVRVTRSGLVGQAASLAISGAGWKGARMRAVLDCAGGAATRTLDLDAEIEAAYRDPKRPDQDLWLYRVNFLNTPKGAAPACDADSDGEKGALAFPGVWDARGARGERPEAFSLACAVAAATKCDRWGYGLADVPDLHAACTRMARADYCGDGKSATQRGTEINPWDSARRVQRGPARERARFEAAWTSAGAVCMDHARWPQLTHECGRSGSGLNEYTLPICHSQAEAEAMAGPGKVLLFNESEQHYR